MDGTMEHDEYDTIDSLDILRGTFGCPGGDHADVDPYFDRPNWQEAAAGDGGSYSGTLEVVRRHPGEPWEDFYQRAQDKALEWNNWLHCSRCFK